MSKVSVFMTVYNKNNVLHNTFRSIAEQKTTFDLEVCVVDDFSSVSPEPILRKYLPNAKFLRLQKNEGFLDSKVHCLDLISDDTDIVILHHPDVILLQNYAYEEIAKCVESKIAVFTEVLDMEVNSDMYKNYKVNAASILNNIDSANYTVCTGKASPNAWLFYLGGITRKDIDLIKYRECSCDASLAPKMRAEGFEAKILSYIKSIHQKHPKTVLPCSRTNTCRFYCSRTNNSRGIRPDPLFFKKAEIISQKITSIPIYSMELKKDSNGFSYWDKNIKYKSVDLSKTALVIIDMWDKFCYKSANYDIEKLAPKIDRFASYLRNEGACIIHSPSTVINTYYKDFKITKKINNIPETKMPKIKDINIPPLPIDDCLNLKINTKIRDIRSGESKSYAAYIKQHDGIYINQDSDYMLESFQLLYNLIKYRNIDTVFVSGVHLNMCVLHNRICLKNLISAGIDTILVKDLTNIAYNPEKLPYVNADIALNLMIEYIEKFLCPTVISEELH